MRQVATGIFHHLDQLDPRILDHRPIDLDHLLSRQIRHVARGSGKSHGYHKSVTGTEGAVQIERGADEREVREGLREVPQRLTAPARLLSVQA